MQDDRIVARVVNEGDGCFTLQVAPEERAHWKEILSSPCGLRLEDLEDPVENLGEKLDQEFSEALEAVSRETERPALVCPLEPDRPWDGSVCEELTGLDETGVELIIEVAKLRDEGGN